MCRKLFFRLSAFFSVALTLSLGSLYWHSACCHCSAPKRRLRWQIGGSGRARVSQCWPRFWGALLAGIFFGLLSCDGFTLYFSNRDSWRVCSLLSRVFSLVACVRSYLLSLISLLPYHLSCLSST